MAVGASNQRMKRVYLDLCALNRPLDDQHQMRVRLEADAVALILTHIRLDKRVLVLSPMHLIEIAANPDVSKREHLNLLLSELARSVDYDAVEARRRANEMLAAGIGAADAAHVAFAEQMNADFVTVDDRLLRQLRRTHSKVWCGTPIAYCEKEELR